MARTDVLERRGLHLDHLANLTHDLKAPIGALAALADVMTEEEDLDVCHRMADRLRSEAERLAGIIDEFLSVAAGTASRTEQHFSVGELLDDAVARVALTARCNDVWISLGRTNEHLVLRGVRHALASALGNLLDNAIKYSRPGTTVELSAVVSDGFLDLRVNDAGAGIAAHDLLRIFDASYRTDEARALPTGGTGLGLAIARAIAGDHDGEILVRSRLGRGSTFTLRLPRSRVRTVLA